MKKCIKTCSQVFFGFILVCIADLLLFISLWPVFILVYIVDLLFFISAWSALRTWNRTDAVCQPNAEAEVRQEEAPRTFNESNASYEGESEGNEGSTQQDTS